MLHRKNWQDIRLFLLVVLIISALGIVLAIKFQRGNNSPSSENNRGAVQQIDKTIPLAPTDKNELIQTETSTIEPTKVMTGAEESLPGAADPAYLAACLKLKEMYESEYNAKNADEDKRHAESQQAIINTYSSEGMSFSLKQKKAHSAETKHHDSAKKELDAKFKGQLSRLRC